MSPRLYAGGAAAAGIMLACFLFVLIMIAGESAQRHWHEQLTCLHLRKSEVPIKDWPAYCQPPGVPAYTPKSEPR